MLRLLPARSQSEQTLGTRVASSLAHNPGNMPPIASRSARNPTSCRTMSGCAHNRTKDPRTASLAASRRTEGSVCNRRSLSYSTKGCGCWVEQNRGTRPTSPQTVPRLAAMTGTHPAPSAVSPSLSGVNTPTRSSVTVSPDFAALGEPRQRFRWHAALCA